MKLYVETGPVGDHPPEEFDVPDEPGIVLDERAFQLLDLSTDDTVAYFDNEDWTEIRIVNEGEL